jgi:predicted ArsR family transcriptional regulator
MAYGTGAVTGVLTGRLGVSARRQRTCTQLLELIRDRGSVTRNELSRLTGLSRSAVAQAATMLLADGLIVEREMTGGRVRPRGRPATLLAPVSRDHMTGIDAGHTQVSVALAGASGRVIAEVHENADIQHNADAVLDTAGRLARDLLDQAALPVTQVLNISVTLAVRCGGRPG